jgi:hypothetical protein
MVTSNVGGGASTKIYVDHDPPIGSPNIIDESLVAGTEFNITVNIFDVVDLYTFDFYLSWDGAILNVTGIWWFDTFFPNVWEGPFLKEGGSTSFSAKGYNGPDPAGKSDYVYVSNTLVGAPKGVDGSGVLAIIEFIVEDYGSSNLDLHLTKLINSHGETIEHVSEDGYFSNKIPGDIDGDKDVDPDDFAIFAGAYGSKEGDPTYDPEADLDRDGDVDPDDFAIFAGNYGRSL